MKVSELYKFYPLIVRAVAFLLAFLVIKLLYDMFIRSRRLKKTWDMLYEQLQDECLIRKEEIDEQKKLQGESYKLPIFEKLDLLISYSGIQLQFPEFNAVIFIILEIATISIAVLATVTLTKRFSFGLLVAAIVAAIPFMVLKISADIQYEATKRDFATFMRMIDTYSGIYKDILTILDRASQYTGNPIRDKVKAAVTIGRIDGSAQKALKWLGDNMEYQLFKDLLKALEITSRNTLKYRNVIEEYMLISEKKSSSMAKQKVIIRKGRFGILAMLALGVVMFYMVIVSVNGNTDIIQGISMFLTTTVGCLILGYLGTVVLGTLWYVFFRMRCE